MIKTATKKEIIVKCLQYVKENKDYILDFLESHKMYTEKIRVDRDDIYLQKERGEIKLELNNWILYEINTDKEIWFIENDIFQKTYEYVKKDLYKKVSFKVRYLKFDKSNDFPKLLISFTGFDNLVIKNNSDLAKFIKENNYVEIKTLEGIEKFCLGEILIEGINSEFYPTKEENFNKVYKI